MATNGVGVTMAKHAVKLDDVSALEVRAETHEAANMSAVRHVRARPATDDARALGLVGFARTRQSVLGAHRMRCPRRN